MSRTWWLALPLAVVVGLWAPRATADATWGLRKQFHFNAGPVIATGLDLGGAVFRRDARQPDLELQIRSRVEFDWRGYGAAIGLGRTVVPDAADEDAFVVGTASIDLRVFHPWTATKFPRTFFVGPEVHTSWAFFLGAFCGAYWSVEPIAGAYDRLFTCGYSAGYD
jgi:hypothetical protein